MLGSLFVGDEAGCRAYLAANPTPHCVYVLHRPDGRPFYVGEGVPTRPFQHEAEARLGHRPLEGNPHKCNVIRAIHRDGARVTYRIDSLHADKPSARRREGELIRGLGRLHEGGPLTNLAGGQDNPDHVAPFSRERHAATLAGESEEPARRHLNEFFALIHQVGSTPIKPMSTYGPKVRRTTGVTKRGALGSRAAAALAASASCNGLDLADGVVIPRLLDVQGVDAIIENGTCERFVGCGLVELVEAQAPRLEGFRLTQNAVGTIRTLLGERRLLDLGL